MTENTPFNDEWNKLQKAFWNNVGGNLAKSSNSSIESHSDTQTHQSQLLNKWLSDIDKCWQDHAQATSTDIDSLYNKISSSSRFFINFTESITSTKQGETTEDLFKKILNEFKVDIPDSKLNDEEIFQPNSNLFNGLNINASWKSSLESSNHQAVFFINQQQCWTKLSGLFDDAAKNSEFTAAVKNYLISLQKYHQILFKLFKASASQVLETLKSSSDESTSPKQILIICLEILEANYMLLISEVNYSKAYADVVNSWMLMLNKSNKNLAEFMNASTSSSQVKPDGQSNGK